MIHNKKRQAKYQNRISYHFVFVVLLKIQPWGLFQVNKATNVFFMILRGFFISDIVINLSFDELKNYLMIPC